MLGRCLLGELIFWGGASWNISYFNHSWVGWISRVIIVVVQVGAVKLYVVKVDGLRKTEREDETQFTTKIGEKTSLQNTALYNLQFSEFLPSFLFPATLYIFTASTCTSTITSVKTLLSFSISY